ncbi:MAG TPA: hypothetical protein PKE63_03000 [Lacibacter sp.]|nr:hypothetical protein [Lacibacter sp.]HMO88183.1 hypothetical protein [Lacibacter sp.]HMP86214.1 hypothetical protein [Lacibacter sp.]
MKTNDSPARLFPALHQRCETLAGNFSEIAPERRLLLQQLAVYIREKIRQEQLVQLVYVCTHNSRRSHLGQVWSAVAAAYYGIGNVHTFSGGTEATAFHANAMAALQRAGLQVAATTTGSNPVYRVQFGEEGFTNCFSKLYNDAGNPRAGFAAIMTCSDADENCPFIPGCDLRIGTTYHDPKAYDGTPLQDEKYLERSNQIALECLYVFSLVAGTA